LFCTP